MDTRFDVNTTNPMDAFRVFAKIIYAITAPFLRFLFYIFMVITVAIGIFFTWKLGFSAGNCLLILAGLLFPLVHMRMIHRLASSMAKSAGGAGGYLQYRFLDDSFLLTDRFGEQSVSYEDVETVIESAKYIFLMRKNFKGHCMEKAAFPDGQTAVFLDFLREKMPANTFFGRYPGKVTR